MTSSTGRALHDPCMVCGHAQWTEDGPRGAACSSCGAVAQCPEVVDWPPALKRWLIAQLVRRALTPHGGAEHPDAWKHLMAVMMRGRPVPVPRLGEFTVSLSATPDDVYAIAAALAARAYPTRTHETTTHASDTKP